MISRFADIEYGIEIRCLSGGCQHCSISSFEITDLLCNEIVGRILQSGIEISGCFQVKKRTHRIGCVIFKRCTLIDRQNSGFACFRCPASLNTNCFLLKSHHILLSGIKDPVYIFIIFIIKLSKFVFLFPVGIYVLDIIIFIEKIQGTI